MSQVDETLTPNELFERRVKQTLLLPPPVLDKYAVALMLLNNLAKTLSPEVATRMLNALLTEYPDREFVDQVEYLPSYFGACDAYLGYKSRPARGLKATRDAAWVPFQRKRESAMVEVLREGQPNKSESDWFRAMLGVKDKE